MAATPDVLRRIDERLRAIAWRTLTHLNGPSGTPKDATWMPPLRAPSLQQYIELVEYLWIYYDNYETTGLQSRGQLYAAITLLAMLVPDDQALQRQALQASLTLDEAFRAQGIVQRHRWSTLKADLQMAAWRDVQRAQAMS